jgi:hemoglobin/transferrin/lactoferrin receptor protein
MSISVGMTYTYGRIKTDSTDVPLDHIPPFLANLTFNYKKEKFSSSFFVNYNGWKRLKDYNPEGEDNFQYATINGMPAWLTVNFRASYQIHKWFNLQAGVDNLFDTQYRTFASGINGGGRNIFVRLNFQL